jgi:hypothetical protein
MSIDKPMLLVDPMSALVASAVEYMIDAGQRSVLFLDILRRARCPQSSGRSSAPAG